MKLRLYTPIYTLTLLLSAALLFSVQPMFSKMILPLLGGAPQVWNTAMLFFQLMLLGGYAYAHATSRLLNVRAQFILHMILLAIFLFVLPIAIPPDWTPPVDKDPTMWQLSLMAITVGGPFFVLAGSAPMLQRWFAGTDHPDADNPYFLYGASNLGSMSALLAYPVIIEPLMNLNAQSGAWSLGYIVLIACTGAAGFIAWNNNQPAISHKNTPDPDPIGWSRRGLWLVLAIIPSSLMLGVTTFITTDVASVPLLWILPLAMYVGTFIIVFARKPIISRERVMLIFAILLIVLLAEMMVFTTRQLILIPLHLLLFFFAALACHMELAAAKPSARHLTEFYLIMSIGGALGGFLNAIIAPQFFTLLLEYALMLGAAGFMRYATDPRQTLLDSKMHTIAALCAIAAIIISFLAPEQFILRSIMAFIMLGGATFLLDRRWLFALTILAGLILYPPGHIWGQGAFSKILHQDRNFFGVIKIIDLYDGERILLHGTTNHGAQSQIPEYKLIPLSYYSPKSPLADAFSVLDKRPGKQNVAIVGLGVGVTACFKKQGRHFDFFEIDPDIARIAETPEYFTFLSDCGSPYDIILGDGRLTIQDKPDQSYDLIVLDAFSSDNIPVHLITVEALQLYLQKLKPGGALVFNISNNYMDIEPVLSNAAKHLNLQGMARVSNGGTLEGTELEYYPAHFFSMSDNQAYNQALEKAGWSAGKFRDGVKLWSDQFSNIISVIINKTGKIRSKELKAALKENP